MNNIEVALKYFEVSDVSNFDEIEKLFHKSATYSSQNTGLYLGIDSILDMQRKFHESFEFLRWKLGKIEEEKTGIVKVDFEFIGMKSGEEIKSLGIEYIIVVDEKIQHIEIRNK